MLRYPSLRAPLDILFLVCCIALTADVLAPEIWGSGKTKDYPLWFWAGQQVLHGGNLYPSDPNAYFEFIYPPLPAVLLAIPAYFGKLTLYICLSVLNAIAWWMTAQFSNAMAGSGHRPGPWLFALPGFVTVTFVFDMFDLGQPNLVLLAMMLFGFWLLQHERPWMAGSMFALATAIKVFPVAVLPYLVWRRQWAAAAGMAVFTAIFLFVVPAPVRGFQHNVQELKTWFQGMVGTSSEQGFGQRGEQNWSWVNQSIIAVTHRLTRPVNYNQDNPAKPAAYMNLADVGFKTANWIVLAVSLLIGLGFIAVMPPRARMTPRSNAEELGILFCLMTVASPLARQYYFMWLFFPITVLIHRAAYDPRAAVRAGTWAGLAVAGLLMCLSLPVFPTDLQAYGNNLAATVVIAAELVWHILHPPLDEMASSLPPAELQIPGTNPREECNMSSAPQLQPVLDRIDADFDNCLERLFALLRIKSISADPAFAGDCKAAADHLAKDIATLGFSTEVRPTAGHPAIVAKSNGNGKANGGSRPHVLFYGHYDVQPVDPLNLWHRPPFEPAVTTHADGRKIIVARGAEDDKGQLMTFVEACRAWKSVTGSLPVDITIVIEGEEEVGSKNFVPFLEKIKDELKADFALVCDTSMWDPNTPAITTSLRGLVYEEVKIKAANRDLHSGIFGGGAQNPIRVLTRILGGIFDENGHITIPGFYDGVKDLPPDVLAQWSKLDLTPDSFLKPIGLSIPAGEKGRLLIEQISSRPTCDINGIIGGYTGEGSKTVIPAEASAKVSFRLVEGQAPDKIRKAFRDYVTARLPGDCTAEFGDHSSAPAIALDWNMKPLAAARRALTEEWGKETVLMGSGASIPIVADFKRTLGLDTVLVGFGLDDDNIHSPNEKYDLKSFHKGIRSWARILAALAEAPR